MSKIECQTLAGVFPKCFAEFSDKKYLSLKGIEPVIFYARDQDATTAPTRDI